MLSTSRYKDMCQFYSKWKCNPAGCSAVYRHYCLYLWCHLPWFCYDHHGVSYFTLTNFQCNWGSWFTPSYWCFILKVVAIIATGWNSTSRISRQSNVLLVILTSVPNESELPNLVPLWINLALDSVMIVFKLSDSWVKILYNTVYNKNPVNLSKKYSSGNHLDNFF